jgi:hypothetical protein
MEEIIELDLNKAWPKAKTGYGSYMDEVEGIARRPRRASKKFIEVIQ